MRYNQQGLRVATTIFEAAAFRYEIKATCPCGNWAVFNAAGLWAHFEKKHWRNEFSEAVKRFRCLRCGTRRARLLVVSAPVTRDVYPMPSMAEWKRAVSRFRC